MYIKDNKQLNSKTYMYKKRQNICKIAKIIYVCITQRILRQVN